MNIHTIILHKKIHLYSQSQNHTTIKNALLKQFISLPAHKLCYLNIHIYIQQILFKKIYERFNPKLYFHLYFQLQNIHIQSIHEKSKKLFITFAYTQKSVKDDAQGWTISPQPLIPWRQHASDLFRSYSRFFRVLHRLYPSHSANCIRGRNVELAPGQPNYATR